MGFCLDLRQQICLQPIDLPIFNPIALELLQLLADYDVDINRVIETINKDQALAIQVLRIANSAAYAGLRPSETIKESVNRLGVKQITNIAMVAALAEVHASNNPIVNFMMNHLWNHSYACAIGCQSLAISTGHRELADQAYMAGLLHDIGKLYLLKAMERISLSGEINFSFDRETLLDVFSGMHVEQGVRIMTHWNIPSTYRSVVANHHAEHLDPHDIQLAIVRLVNFNSKQFDLDYFPSILKNRNTNIDIATLHVNETARAQLEFDMRNSCT